MGGPRPAFNGRSGSPMSLRSIGTSASVSAVDIINAINNKQFNMYEIIHIKGACINYATSIRKKKDCCRCCKIHSRLTEQKSISSISSSKGDMCTDYIRNSLIRNANTTQLSLSVIPTSIPENAEKELQVEMNPQNGDLDMDKNSERDIERDSDDYEIFSNSTNVKRKIDSGDICLPNQKRLKTLSPRKNDVEARKLKASARKFAKEKLISKRTAPLSPKSRIESLWDTDFESDASFQPTVRIEKLILKENLRLDIRPNEAAETQDLRSHRAPKINKLDRTTNGNKTKKKFFLKKVSK